MIRLGNYHKAKRMIGLLVAVIMMASLPACSRTVEEPAVPTEAPAQEITQAVAPTVTPTITPTTLPTPELLPASVETTEDDFEIIPGHIYMLGEIHSDDYCLENELKIWGDFYENGVRHLFFEDSYYTAEFLNLWMHADSDEILDQLYIDWEGTISHSQNVLDFYHRIKQDYPETIFHGVDVGHQYNTTGTRYMAYLRENGLQESEAYVHARENIVQGTTFYLRKNADMAYRENCMVENFIHEYDGMAGETVVGIFHVEHAAPDGLAPNSSIGNLGNQLSAHYGESYHFINVVYRDPLRKESLYIGGKEYEAVYYGSADISAYEWRDYKTWEFWSLENTNEDFATNVIVNGDILKRSFVPFPLEKGSVIVIEFTNSDGSKERRYYREEGLMVNSAPVLQGFYAE